MLRRSSLVLTLLVALATSLLGAAASGAAVAATRTSATAAHSAATPHAATTTVRYGPFNIPGGTMEKPGSVNTMVFAQKPCSLGSCDITGMTPDLVYPDGKSADMDSGPMLHHFVIFNVFGASSVCGRPVQPVFSSGNERTPKVFPAGYGMHVKSTDAWMMVVELMNSSPQAKQVYISLTYNTAPANSTTALTDEWLDVTNCLGFTYYNVPAGASQQTWTWTAPVNGKVVLTYGHLHDGGQHISEYNLTTNQMICDAKATYGDMGGMKHIAKMGECVGNPVAMIHKGDRIKITAYYDTDMPETGVMGIMPTYVAAA